MAYNKLCAGANPSYKGSRPCAYNMAIALADTKNMLKANLSADSARWTWGNVHTNTYPSTPWSNTPLKFLFHRELPSSGNINTPNVSKCSIKKASETGKFVGTNSGNFKMLIQMDKDASKEINQYSIDTGNGSNILQPHYFTMNRDHLDGKLTKMIIGQQI